MIPEPPIWKLCHSGKNMAGTTTPSNDGMFDANLFSSPTVRPPSRRAKRSLRGLEAAESMVQLYYRHGLLESSRIIVGNWSSVFEFTCSVGPPPFFQSHGLLGCEALLHTSSTGFFRQAEESELGADGEGVARHGHFDLTSKFGHCNSGHDLSHGQTSF